MGRKPKNKFIETNIAFEKGTEFRLFDVTIPFVYSITVEIVNPNLTKAQTTWEYYAKSPSDMDRITKEIENDPFGLKVIKIEESTRKFTDVCPRCGEKGVPKIEKKDTSDKRERSWRHKEKTPRKEKPSEFWLTYTHSRLKKCRICQYVNTPAPAYKKNYIDISKYFFPQVIGNMKRGLV